MRVCTKCHKSLPESSFGKRKDCKSGYKSRCKTCLKEDYEVYCEKNKDKRVESYRNYYKRHKDRHLARVRKRQIGLGQRTPNWLTEDQTTQIENFYWLARDLSSFGDEPYEVDHIIPLHGEYVSGLHVPWNLQVLPRSINRSKHNTYNGPDQEFSDNTGNPVGNNPGNEN